MSVKIQHQGAGVLFSFEAHGEVQLQSFIMGIASRCKDLRPVWNKIDDILRNDVDSIFKMEGRKPSWPQLQDSTIRDRIRHGFSGAHPILQRTKLLRDSLRKRSHPKHIFVSKKLSMEFGTTVPYAIYHQSSKPRQKVISGPRAGQDRLPRRQFIWLDKKVVAKIIGKIRQWAIYKKV